MYRIGFYEDGQEREPVKEFINELAIRTDKDSRVNIQKIYEYMAMLAEKGTYAGKPYVKYITKGLWGLRPLRNRIFFFCFEGDTTVFLHHFVKKTKKTPREEIQKAMKRTEQFRRMHDGRQRKDSRYWQLLGR